ncbi:hypothetical protein GMRT_10020 [Giardia muris]|uniref:Uncharacterized protein n=1 Tax=Giardia muris TaxID=5742 RepID=A0A4Z1T2A4_GIAMU|nr:hypothetical protein GMRT_10020 [Giardia muris]|eukprot:TNJ28063.1 hypothetical protein GMRT_10020 [Giardia muris]
MFKSSDLVPYTELWTTLQAALQHDSIATEFHPGSELRQSVERALRTHFFPTLEKECQRRMVPLFCRVNQTCYYQRVGSSLRIGGDVKLDEFVTATICGFDAVEDSVQQ